MSEKVLVYPFSEKKLTVMFTFDDEIEAGIYTDNAPPLSIKIRDIQLAGSPGISGEFFFHIFRCNLLYSLDNFCSVWYNKHII